MPVIERKARDFELRGYIQLIRTGTTVTGDDWGLVSVSGFSFFLPAVWVPELALYWEGQQVIAKGEYVGDRIRNGNREPSFELYALEAVDGQTRPAPIAPERIPRVSVNGGKG